MGLGLWLWHKTAPKAFGPDAKTHAHIEPTWSAQVLKWPSERYKVDRHDYLSRDNGKTTTETLRKNLPT